MKMKHCGLKVGCIARIVGGSLIRITRIRRLTRMVDGEALSDPYVRYIDHLPMEGIIECWEDEPDGK